MNSYNFQAYVSCIIIHKKSPASKLVTFGLGQTVLSCHIEISFHSLAVLEVY